MRTLSLCVSDTIVNSGLADLSRRIGHLDWLHCCNEHSGQQRMSRQSPGGGFMKSLVQAVTIAVALSAPVASFAQSAGQPVSQDSRTTLTPTPTHAAGQRNVAPADSSGYGAGNHGSWQSGRGTDTTVSSYSPPIYNAR
jgi:hypothetical protein